MNRSVLKSRYSYKRLWKRVLAWTFDVAGTLCSFPFRKQIKRPEADHIRKILVLRLDGLGDVLMTRPALAALQQIFPKARIDLMVQTDWVKLMEGEVSGKVWPVSEHWFCQVSWWQQWKTFGQLLKQVKEERYDLAIDFRGDLRHILLMTLAGIPNRVGYGVTGGGFFLTLVPEYPQERHQVEVNLELLKVFGPLPQKIENRPLEVLSRQHGLSRNPQIEFLLTGEGKQVGTGHPRILIHPGAAYPSKRWGWERYQRLIERLGKELGATIVIVGKERERQEYPLKPALQGTIIDLRGCTEICDLPALMLTCDLFIGNDSGPAHMAGVQGIPTLVLYSGTNDWRLWRPWGERVDLIRHEVPCAPCEARQCPLGHHDCMRSIQVEEVISKVKAVLAAKGFLPYPSL